MVLLDNPVAVTIRVPAGSISPPYTGSSIVGSLPARNTPTT